MLLFDPCKLCPLEGEVSHKSLCIKDKAHNRIPGCRGIKARSCPDGYKGYIAVYTNFPAFHLPETLAVHRRS